MGRKCRSLIVILLLIAGIAVMGYPSLSDHVNTIHSSRVVQQLTQKLDSADPATLEQQRQLAQQYNDALRDDPGAAVLAEYERILDFGNGIMGSIRIPAIDVELSIYHGVSDAVLQKGVGHMPRSALPVGGPGSHAVLTGHTGLPSAELFTDLTELAEGDQFYLSVLGETLVYEVDQITVVLPHEVEELGAVRGRDYCTLVTCTPYGINSHRLLVRGERVQMAPETAAQQAAVAAEEAVRMPPELVAAGLAVAVLLVMAVVVLIRREKTEGDP